MMKSIRTRAEEQFAALQKRPQRALTEQEIEKQARVEKSANLRLLRIAKERVSKAHAENTSAKK